MDNQSCFLLALQRFAERQELCERVTTSELDLAKPDQADEVSLVALLRPPLGLVNVARFMHRSLLDAVVKLMPPGCTLAVHHFLEGAVSLKSGRHIKPHDADQRSLKPGELRDRYGSELTQILLDEEVASCDCERPMVSFVARKPPLLSITIVDGSPPLCVRVAATTELQEELYVSCL